ncbi:MAG: hypothetical protein CMH83_19090 [Nocardioides sp.]|nr:hypothetical protein [Nocardioides sp.]
MSSSGRRGSVKQEPNGTWTVVVDVPGDDLDARGRPKRKQTRRRGFTTRRAAQQKLNELLHELDQRAYVALAPVTLAEFITETWLPAAQHTIKESTYDGYRRALTRHVVERPIGRRKLQDIDGPTLNKHYAVLLAGDAAHPPIGVTTARGVSTVLHRVFKDAVRWRKIQTNPVEASDPPKKAERTEFTTWTLEEQITFLEHAAAHRHFGLWALLATTGMRRGEALGMRWRDIDLDNGRAQIQRALVNIGNGQRAWSSPKTKAGRRTIILDEECIAALRVHRARQAQEKLALGPGYNDEDLVTAQEDGSTISPTRITEQFRRLTRRAGLRHIRLHDLRHTYATLALEAGIHPRVVQEQLGHSHVSITLDIYSHVDVKMHQSAANLLATARREARDARAAGGAP